MCGQPRLAGLPLPTREEHAPPAHSGRGPLNGTPPEVTTSCSGNQPYPQESCDFGTLPPFDGADLDQSEPLVLRSGPSVVEDAAAILPAPIHQDKNRHYISESPADVLSPLEVGRTNGVFV
jgi:hypothetical protein